MEQLPRVYKNSLIHNNDGMHLICIMSFQSNCYVVQRDFWLQGCVQNFLRQWPWGTSQSHLILTKTNLWQENNNNNLHLEMQSLIMPSIVIISTATLYDARQKQQKSKTKEWTDCLLDTNHWENTMLTVSNILPIFCLAYSHSPFSVLYMSKAEILKSKFISFMSWN